MARYTGAACKLCRREGQKLFLKGERCYSAKCAVSKRAYAPGQHGQGRKKVSEYGRQLRTKQFARRYYGVLEGQFRHYFEMATKMPGAAGENLLRLLESRLDNVVYRAGFASSRAQARQMITQGHFTVNGRRVTIPSFLTKADAIVAVSEKSRTLDFMKALVEANSGRPAPKWMDADREKMEAKILALPNREEIDLPIEETLIVELYSK